MLRMRELSSEELEQTGPPAPRRAQQLQWLTEDIARFLADVPIFQELDFPARYDLAVQARLTHLQRGQFVFFEGEPIEMIYLLARGRVKLLRETEDGREVIVRLVGPGDAFGIVGNGPEWVERFSARAGQESVVIEIPATAFCQVLSESADCLRATLGMLGALLWEAESRICDLQTRNAESRLARVLLRLAARPAARLNGSFCFDLALTRQELADLAGTNLSTASRAVSIWAKSGILALRRGRLTILNEAALCRIATGAETRGMRVGD